MDKKSKELLTEIRDELIKLRNMLAIHLNAADFLDCKYRSALGHRRKLSRMIAEMPDYILPRLIEHVERFKKEEREQALASALEKYGVELEDDEQGNQT